ncbi:MAG: hypothetical protein JKY50_19000 [Oleispira sp.]|nr:hypothetical protein [Oleispira sp.]
MMLLNVERRGDGLFLIFHVGMLVICMAAFILKDLPTAASPIFDVYILCLVIFSLFKSSAFIGRKALVWIMILLVYFGGYVTAYYSFNEYGYVSNYEMFRSIRFVYYLLAFILVSELALSNGEKVRCISSESYSTFFFYLVVVMTLVYLVKIILLGSSRPTLYSENNYEIPSILIAYSIFQTLNKKDTSFRGKVTTYLSYFLAILSLSKSAVIEAVFVYLKIKMNRPTATNILILLFSVPLGLLLIYAVFSLRSTEGVVDRLQFLVVFLDLVQDFSFQETMLGKGLANELPFSSCMQLKFWASRMFSDYSYCNSTAFFSFQLKVFYDFGLIGLLLCLGTWCYFLVRYYGVGLGTTIFLIMFLCSLSVSGFNNSIIIWTIFLGLLVRRSTTS